MAESVTSWPARRGTVITLKDGSRTFAVVHGEIDPKMTDRSFDLVWSKDSNGNYHVTARQGDQTGPSTLDLSGVQVFHAGDHPTEAAIVDIAFGTGWFAANWSSTEAGSDFKNITIEVKLPQNVAGTTYSTWTLTDAFVAPSGVGMTIGNGKVKIDNLVLTSANGWTVADTP